MRKAINENPKVQIGLLGGLALIVGLLLITRMGSGEATPPASATPTTGSSTAGGTTAATTSPTAGTTAAAPSSTSSTAVTSTPTALPTPVAPNTTSVSPDALEPGPGLPRPLIKAWKSGDAVVLLIVRNGAVDDQLVRFSVERLSDPGVAVFVSKAKGVARYSRITQGVGVDRVPALVVIRPKRLSGGVPKATVSYGFRGVQSVVQAVRDALYSGKDNLPYDPR